MGSQKYNDQPSRAGKQKATFDAKKLLCNHWCLDSNFAWIPHIFIFLSFLPQFRQRFLHVVDAFQGIVSTFISLGCSNLVVTFIHHICIYDFFFCQKFLTSNTMDISLPGQFAFRSALQLRCSWSCHQTISGRCFKQKSQLLVHTMAWTHKARYPSAINHADEQVGAYSCLWIDGGDLEGQQHCLSRWLAQDWWFW